MLKRVRHRFWSLLGGGLMRAAKFCILRKARLCSCFGCYMVINAQRLAKEAIDDAIRAEFGGRPPADRRPS